MIENEKVEIPMRLDFKKTLLLWIDEARWEFWEYEIFGMRILWEYELFFKEGYFWKMRVFTMREYDVRNEMKGELIFNALGIF